MNKTVIACAIMILLICGCTRHYRVEGIAVDGNRVSYNQGYAIATLYGQQVELSCAVCQRVSDNERLYMALRITNNTSKAVEFVPGNVSAFLNESPNQFFSQEYLLQEEESRYHWDLVLQAFVSTVNNISADQAGHSIQTGKYSQNGYYAGQADCGFISASGRWQAHSYNSTDAFLAKSIANFQNAQRFSNSHSDHIERLSAIRSHVLTRTTIAPYQFIEGLMIFEGISKRQCPQSDIYSFEVVFSDLSRTPCRFRFSKLG